jgi:hypothetical protein
MPDRFGLGRIRRNIEQTKRRLPILLAKQAEEHFVDSFDKSSWEGKTWKVPQRRIPGTRAYKYPLNRGLSRRTKPTLTLTGKLRRATANSIRDARWQLIRLRVDLPYASIHNDGEGNMPKRKYMGDGPSLRRKQKTLINKTIGEIWR